MKDLHSLESNNEQAAFIQIDEGMELRCPHCNKLFAKGNLGEGGKIEQKCPRCKNLCRFEKL
jgi:uncharacterized C2H2 Zn-finger protein